MTNQTPAAGTTTEALDDRTLARAIRPPIWEDEFCRAFRITKRTARRWRVERRGPRWFYVNKRPAYSPEAIAAWISDLETRGQGAA